MKKKNWEIRAEAKTFSAHFQAVFLFVYLRKKKGLENTLRGWAAKSKNWNLQRGPYKQKCNFFNGKKKRQSWSGKKKKQNKKKENLLATPALFKSVFVSFIQQGNKKERPMSGTFCVFFFFLGFNSCTLLGHYRRFRVTRISDFYF